MAKDSEITRSLIIKNAVYSVFSWLFPIFVGLVSTKIIVGSLGTESFGLYAMIIGFVSYSFSFGIGKTVAKYVAELRSAGEIEKMSESISAVLFVSTAIGIAVTVLVYISAPAIVSDALEIPVDLRPDATTALVVAAVTILFTMVSQVFQFILQGLHRFDRYLFLTNITGLLLSAGNVILVLKGFGVVALISWNCILVFLSALAFFFVSQRLLPEFSLRLSISREVWRTVLTYAASIVAYQAFGNALLIFERAWIVRKFGTEALTFYVLPMLLCFYFHGLVSSLIVVLFPVVNQLLNDRAKLVRVYRVSTKVILALSAFFAVTTMIEGRIFLAIWQDARVAELSYRILVIHVITFSIISIATVAWQITESFGVARANALAGAAWFLVSVPLMVVLSQTWQTEGVAVARLIGVTAFIGVVVYVERKFMSGSGDSFWPKTLLRIAAAASATALVEFAIIWFLQPGILAFVVCSLFGGLTFALALYFVGFVEDEERATFNDITARLRRSDTR